VQTKLHNFNVKKVTSPIRVFVEDNFAAQSPIKVMSPVVQPS